MHTCLTRKWEASQRCTKKKKDGYQSETKLREKLWPQHSATSPLTSQEGQQTPKRTAPATWDSGTSGPIKRRDTTDGGDDEGEWLTGYGDNYQKMINNKHEAKPYEPFVVSSMNAHYLGERGSPSIFNLQEAIKENTVQGLSELNLNFSRVPAHDQLKERMKNTWRAGLKSINTWIRDRDFRKSDHQLGGVAMLTHGETSSFVQTTGEDREGLARWNWMFLKVYQ